MAKDTRTGLLLVLPLIALTLFVSLFPMLYTIWLSVHNATLLGGVKEFVGLANFARLFRDPFVSAAAFVSLQFIIIVVAISFVVSIGIALLLNEPFHGKSVMKVIVILPWALSEFAVAVTGRYVLNSDYGLLDSILESLHIIKYGINFLSATYAVDWLAIFYAWNFAPIGAFFILSSLQTIPDSLYKSAKIDGASVLMRFRTITFPYIRYSVLITLVIVTLAAAGSVVISFALTGGGPGNSSEPITLYAFTVFFDQGNYGYGSAITWMTLLFVSIATTTYFFLIMRRK